MSRPRAGGRRLFAAAAIATLLVAARMSGAPVNDNFAKSTAIASGGGTVTGSNVDATKQSSEPAHGGNPGGKSVWWTWTASSDASVTVSTFGSDFDTLLGVYTGPSAGNLVTVGSSDDIGDETTSALAFAAVSGTTYRIAVDGWADPDGGVADSGNISLSVTLGGARPANDDFASAASISAAGGTANGSNVNGTRQGGEPMFAGDSGMRSVWWTWTPSQSGSVLIETAGSDFDTILGVFTGSAVTSLTLVGENDDAAGQSTSSLVIPVTGGTTYRIAVDGWGGDDGIVSLAVQLIDNVAPGNDNLADAFSIPGSGGTTSGTNVNATKQTGEPNHAGDFGGRSVWWKWTAPGNGVAVISTAGSSFDTLLGVYTGTSVDALATVASSDDDGELLTSRVEFIAISGTTYRVAVDGFGALVGNIDLSVQFTAGAAPGNDAFASAISLPANGGSTAGTNVGATKETGEPAHAGDNGGHSVWWSWTAPDNGTARFDTAGSSFDTSLAVYTGATVNALGEVTSSNDDGELVTSRVEFAAVSGTTYRIAVDGWGGAVGSVSLAAQFIPASAPANDAFADALVIASGGGNTTGTNVDATKEAGEPNHAGNSGGHSVWWSWTSTGNGTATISTAGSGFDTLLGVYTGSGVGALTDIAASNDDGNLVTSRVAFAATSGTTYRIAVDGWGGAVGSVSLSVQFTANNPPANDAFANALTFAPEGGNNLGTNVDATKEAGEPVHAQNAGGRSVWWKWTPSLSGTATISTAGSGFDTLLGIYTGAGVDALAVVASSDDDGVSSTSLVEFSAVSGTTYRIAVDGYNDAGAIASGQISLTIVNSVPPAAPVASAATAVTTSGFTANWSTASGATGYRLDVSTSDTFASFVTGYQNLDVGNATGAIVSGLASSTTYYYRVRAYNGSGTSPNSGTIAVTTATAPPPPPAAPVASAATAITSSGFTANWSAAGGATGYRLDVSTNDAFASFVTGYQNLDVGNVTSRVVSGLAASTAYHYRVRAYNGSGTGSNSGTIAVTTAAPPPVAPTITTHPSSLTVTAGQPASFTVVASGTAPLSYQWRKGGVDIGGATSATYNIASTVTGDAGSYTVVVTNSAGNAASNAATLTVTAAPLAPSITTHPSSLTVTAGQPASFTVVASGTAPLSYQWRKGGVDIGGATSTTYNIAATVAGDAGSYTVVVTNSAGNATSDAATLTVNAASIAPSITTNPLSLTVTAGQPASFTVVATGTAPLSYQWRKGGVNIAGATSATYNIASAQSSHAGNYTVFVSNSAGSVTSGTATLAVNVPPSITSHPASKTAVIGSDVIFSVTATGTAPLNYQWKRNGANVAGATNSTLVVPDVQPGAGATYTVVVTNVAGSVTSNPATLALDATPRLINVSCLASAGSGDSTLVVGFYINGNGSKDLLIRGIGPRLGGDPFNRTGVVTDPRISVYNSAGNLIASNDDWDPVLAADFTRIGAFGLVNGSKDSALKVTLSTGLYTVHMVNPGSVADGLIEVYDISRDLGTRLSNVSCRLDMKPNETVILGTALIASSTPVLARSVGPGLADYGIPLVDTLPDPDVRVYAGSTQIAYNDDWSSSLEPFFETAGAFTLPAGSKDAATRVTFTQGSLTVHATGKGGTGIAIIEIYESP